ncbi:MAG TPA: L,D-transpeptidase family protein [Allosphingosinicella sp.]|jgi:murein L,D-transpeptidase YcbB/YkuD|nr:L,D-transpeptidase family protein [Allosphingosinicella sp.]
MRKVLVCVSLAALLAGGCNQLGGGGGGSQNSAAPSQELAQIAPQDLQAAATDPDVRRFYEARGWSAVWTKDLAKDLRAALADAPRQGLKAESFLDETKGGTPAEREVALTKAALDYAHALAFGVVDPKKVFDPYTVPRPKFDLTAGLQQAVTQGHVGNWLTSLAPSDPEYKALSDEFLRYRQASAGAQPQPIPSGDKIEPGHRDPRVPAIAAALRRYGFAPTQAPAPQPGTKPVDQTTYTKQMASEVARVQLDYGIKPDGIIGNDTLEALNNGAVERARILAVNLERRRWLDRSPPPTRIDVNTAAAVLTYWRDGQAANVRRVVVGQPGWETPEIGARIFRLVANPDWTLPDKIADEEVRPKGAAYMAKQHIAEKNGRLVQEPGPDNALGLVKFDMDDPYAIYLHDTPAKALFASPDRHASHGCTRVDDALGFARMLADEQGIRNQFEQALATQKETNVALPKPIPVRLMYQTAYLENGRVVFRPDPYGWDDKLAQALGFNTQLRHRELKHIESLAP